MDACAYIAKSKWKINYAILSVKYRWVLYISAKYVFEYHCRLKVAATDCNRRTFGMHNGQNEWGKDCTISKDIYSLISSFCFNSWRSQKVRYFSHFVRTKWLILKPKSATYFVLTNREIILLLFDGGLQDECIWTFFSEIVFSKLSYYSLLQLLLGNRTTQIHIKRWYIIVLNCIWRYLFAFYMYGIICLLYIIYSSEFVFTLPLSFNQSENQTFR